MAGFSNVNGDESIVYGDNVSFDGTERGGKVTTNGQLLIGATASPHIRVNTLSSSDGSVTITNGQGTIDLTVDGGTTVVTSLVPQTGTSPVAPIGGLINLNGAVVAAGTNPVRTNGTGTNNLAVELQRSQAIASTNASNIGLAAFDSAAFDVDANGFVQLNGGGIATTSVNVDAATAPGTDPVVPTAAGQITVTGGQVAAGTTTNVIQTNSLAANTYTVQVQRSSAQNVSTVGANGVSHYNDDHFSVDSDGFVSATGNVLLQTTEDSGTATPAAGNLNLLGQQAGTIPVMFTIGDNAATARIEDRTWTTPLVVDPSTTVGLRGTFSTIAAALAAAVSGQTIFIRPGTYTENLTLVAGVNLVSYVGNELTPTVTINGTLSASFAGSASISGIRLQTNSANFLSISGSSATQINLQNCYLNCSNNTGISYTSSSSSSQLLIMNCRGNIGTTGITLYSKTSPGTMLIEQTVMTNTGLTTTRSSHSAGIVSLLYCRLPIPFGSTSAGEFGTINFCTLDTSDTNTTTLDHAGNQNCTITNTYIASGTAVCLTIGASSGVQANDIQLRTGNTNAASGSGTLTYTDIQYMGTGKGLAVTTLNRQQVEGGFFRGIQDNTTPGTGCIGQRISSMVTAGSAVSVPSTSPRTITSITLTPGCWDISAMGVARGGLTGTEFQVSISTTTNSITGNNGDNVALSPTVPSSGRDNSLTVPPWRVNISANTTYYLVIYLVYSGGTGTGYGRISAVRVA